MTAPANMPPIRIAGPYSPWLRRMPPDRPDTVVGPYSRWPRRT
jgi:hypothetical protein